MTEVEIIAAIRRGIREPSARTVSNDDISDVITRGIVVAGLEIKEIAPSFFNTRTSVSSDTHVFPWPTDCVTVLNVWDLKTNAATITAASNASPIVITSVAHGFSDDAIVVVHGVLGNTAANGTWKVDESADDTFELYGSTGDGAWTSGGKVFELKSSIRRILKKNIEASNLRDKSGWFPQGTNVVVDHPDFTYDIMLDYIYEPSATTDIPSEYHEYLVSFGVIDLMRVPAANAPDYQDKATTLQLHISRLEKIRADMNRTLKASTEPQHIPEEFDFEDYMII
jgi:hypothetical protein